MDKELEAIKTAIENYRHNTETRHKENVQKAIGIARQMFDWLEEQYKPYKEVIGDCTINVWLGNNKYQVVYNKDVYISYLYFSVHKGVSALDGEELALIKMFVANWQRVKDEVTSALASKNKQCLDKEQSLRNTELETQELFDGFEV